MSTPPRARHHNMPDQNTKPFAEELAAAQKMHDELYREFKNAKSELAATAAAHAHLGFCRAICEFRPDIWDTLGLLTVTRE